LRRLETFRSKLDFIDKSEDDLEDMELELDISSFGAMKEAVKKA